MLIDTSGKFVTTRIQYISNSSQYISNSSLDPKCKWIGLFIIKKNIIKYWYWIDDILGTNNYRPNLSTHGCHFSIICCRYDCIACDCFPLRDKDNMTWILCIKKMHISQWIRDKLPQYEIYPDIITHSSRGLN